VNLGFVPLLVCVNLGFVPLLVCTNLGFMVPLMFKLLREIIFPALLCPGDLMGSRERRGIGSRQRGGPSERVMGQEVGVRLRQTVVRTGGGGLIKGVTTSAEAIKRVTTMA